MASAKIALQENQGSVSHLIEFPCPIDQIKFSPINSKYMHISFHTTEVLLATYIFSNHHYNDI